MYARLGFAVASHVNPDVLLVDEVLSVGDHAFQQKCVEHMKRVIRSGATVLFVSHNLKTIAEFCPRCLSLDRGRIIKSGPVQDVISAYLNRPMSANLKDPSSKSAVISRVAVRDEHGECSRFQSGQKAWIDIEVTGHRCCSKLSVGLFMKDDQLRDIFDATTERLGYGNFSLQEGDIFRCTFELHLNMVSGIYYPSVLVYRYDTQTRYDSWESPATIYVSSEEDVHGTVHCFPKVIHQEIRRATDAGPGAIAGVGRNGWDRLPE
jgi:hypothetical protein